MNEQLIICLVLGAVIIALGFPALRGNVSMLHSYHRKRVKAEDLLPFGRLIAISNFVIGGGLMAAGILFFFAERGASGVLSFTAPAVLIATMLAGLVLSFYAMIKYNKGIF